MRITKQRFIQVIKEELHLASEARFKWSPGSGAEEAQDADGDGTPDYEELEQIATSMQDPYEFAKQVGFSEEEIQQAKERAADPDWDPSQIEYSEPITPTSPPPIDFVPRVVAAFADHAEELGYTGIPRHVWQSEAARLRDEYIEGTLSVTNLDDLLGRIEIDYFDEYIEDIAHEHLSSTRGALG